MLVPACYRDRRACDVRSLATYSLTARVPYVNVNVPFRRADDNNNKIIADLREHALFALRNILHNNPENQAVVDTFRVSG